MPGKAAKDKAKKHAAAEKARKKKEGGSLRHGDVNKTAFDYTCRHGDCAACDKNSCCFHRSPDDPEQYDHFPYPYPDTCQPCSADQSKKDASIRQAFETHKKVPCLYLDNPLKHAYNHGVTAPVGSMNSMLQFVFGCELEWGLSLRGQSRKWTPQERLESLQHTDPTGKVAPEVVKKNKEGKEEGVDYQGHPHLASIEAWEKAKEHCAKCRALSVDCPLALDAFKKDQGPEVAEKVARWLHKESCQDPAKWYHCFANPQGCKWCNGSFDSMHAPASPHGEDAVKVFQCACRDMPAVFGVKDASQTAAKDLYDPTKGYSPEQLHQLLACFHPQHKLHIPYNVMTGGKGSIFGQKPTDKVLNCHFLGYLTSEEEAQLFQLMDTDGDGFVCLREYAQFWKELKDARDEGGNAKMHMWLAMPTVKHEQAMVRLNAAKEGGGKPDPGIENEVKFLGQGIKKAMPKEMEKDLAQVRKKKEMAKKR